MRRWGLRLFGALAVWLALVFAWIWQGPEEDRFAHADYALVLGAAVYGDQPSPVFAARIDHAIDLWRLGRVRAIIFSGGLSGDDSVSEAEAGRNRALAAGVPLAAIMMENQSRTTHQNIGFTHQVLLTDPNPSVLVVSDPLHLTRAMQMAAEFGLDAQPSATPLTRYRSASTKVPFALRELYFMHHYWLLGE